MFNNTQKKIHISDYVKWLNDTQSGDWKWLNNSNCKHVKVHFDTRGEYVIICDRDGEMVTLDELIRQ